MKAVVNIICVFVLGWLLWPYIEDYIQTDWSFSSSVASERLAKPENTYGLDSAIPGILKDKATAHKLTGLFTGLADTLAQDAERSKPETKYASNIRDILHEAVTIQFNGKKLNEAASGLGDVVGPVIEKEFPDGSVELDSNSRKKASDIFRAAAYGCALVK